jgi:hypothetical protein
MSRFIKLCAMSVVLAMFAPVILLSMWTKKKVGVRIGPALQFVHFHFSSRRDLWTREVTLYELVAGEIPRKKKR